MAGIFNLDLSSVGGAVQGVSKGVTDLAQGIRSAITGQISPDRQAEILGHLNDLDAAAQAAQAEVDKAEANSSNLFVAGCRPFIGWVCGAVLAYNYFFRPIIGIVPGVPSLPMLNMAEISPVLIGLLGLGTMRTVEKVSGAAGNH
jgi:hypothetical protein